MIEEGTTGQQVAIVGRWLWVAIIIIGMLTWWAPGYLAWGALIIGVLVVFVLLLISMTLLQSTRIISQRFHTAMLIPVVIISTHVAFTSLARAKGVNSLGGSGNVSLLFHFTLLSCAVMLSQCLLPNLTDRATAGHFGLASLCGAAMVGGSIIAITVTITTVADIALSLLGFAGIVIWLSAFWSVRPRRNDYSTGILSHRIVLHCGLSVAVVWAILLVIICPKGAILAAGVLTIVLLVGAFAFSARRKLCVIIGAIAASVVVASIVAMGFDWSIYLPREISAFGVGERVYAQKTPASSGFDILCGAIGYVGASWLVMVLAGALVINLLRSKKGKTHDRVRAILWALACSLATIAFFSPGGMMIPSVTLAVALTWGNAHSIAGSKPRSINGIVLVAATVAIFLTLGLVRRQGLATQTVLALGGSDEILHAAVGFILTIVLTWWMGSKSLLLGFVGIIISIFAGALGEFAQITLSSRSGEWSDFYYHCLGAAVAIIPYLLCKGATLYEKPANNQH